MRISPDSKVHGDNMGPTWVLPAPDGPHVGHMNLGIRVIMQYHKCIPVSIMSFGWWEAAALYDVIKSWAVCKQELWGRQGRDSWEMGNLTHWPLGNSNENLDMEFSNGFEWLMVDWGISCENTMIWMSLDFTDDQSTLVQGMAWCHQATSHYLSHCWPRSVLPYGITRPQWANSLAPGRCGNSIKGVNF